MDSKCTTIVFFKEKAVSSENVYAFLQHVDFPRPFDGIEKEPECKRLRYRTANRTDHSLEKGNNRNISVGEGFGLKPSNILRGIMHVVRSKYSARLFCNASAWPYHCFYLNSFHRIETAPECRLDSATVE